MTDIRAIETIRLRQHPNLVYALVHDSDGATGLGETYLGAEAVEAYLHESVAPMVLGRDPHDIEGIARSVSGVLGRSGAGVESRGNSALDIALWDLLGRRSGLSLTRLWGGPSRPSVKVYNTCAGYEYVKGVGSGVGSDNWGLGKVGLGPYEDLDRFLHDAGGLAEDLLGEGIAAMKIWPFDRAAELTNGQHLSPGDLRECLRPLKEIRERVGLDMEVMLEFHSMWNLPVALQIVRAADEYAPTWYEDLMPAQQVEELSRVAASTATPLTLSETVAGLANFRRLFASRAAGVAMLDVGWLGGITEARKVAAVAESYGLPVAPHDCTGPVVLAVSTHLSTHLRNGFIQETVRAFLTSWYPEIAEGLPVVSDGRITPSDAPGHGVSLRRALLDSDQVLRRVSSR